MELIIILFGSCAVTGLFVRSLHYYYIRKQFNRPFAGIPDELKQAWAKHRVWKFSKANAIEGSAIGINTGQTLYHLSQIDDRVLTAIDRIYDPTKVNSYQEILAHISEKNDQGASVWEGAINSYKGTVGEAFIAENLRASGHFVTMAESNSQEGWDAVVDGEKVNFKSGLGTEHIQEHLDRFPDIPVVTVAEQADFFGDNPDVTCLQDVSGEQIADATGSTMESAIEMGDFDIDIPLVTLALSSARHFTPVFRGTSNDIGTAVKYTAADTAGVGFGAAAGAKAGALIGAFGGPPGAAIGAVIGGIVGVMGGRHLAKSFKETALREAIATIDMQIAGYSKAYIDGLYQKAIALEGSANGLRRPFSIVRVFAPTPGDVLRSDMRHAYRKWAKACRALAETLRRRAIAGDNEPPDFNSLGRDLLANPPEESVYSRAVSAVLCAIRSTANRIQQEKLKLGYS
jgi:hypothetical protein